MSLSSIFSGVVSYLTTRSRPLDEDITRRLGETWGVDAVRGTRNRKDGTIILYNAEGEKVLTYKLVPDALGIDLKRVVTIPRADGGQDVYSRFMQNGGFRGSVAHQTGKGRTISDRETTDDEQRKIAATYRLAAQEGSLTRTWKRLRQSIANCSL